VSVSSFVRSKVSFAARTYSTVGSWIATFYDISILWIPWKTLRIEEEYFSRGGEMDDQSEDERGCHTRER
jgi:hypothetical protein